MLLHGYCGVHNGPPPASFLLLQNYGTMAIGLMLVRRGVDAGFCFIFVGVLSYNMCTMVRGAGRGSTYLAVSPLGRLAHLIFFFFIFSFPPLSSPLPSVYAPLLYRVAHADTLYIKDRQEEVCRLFSLSFPPPPPRVSSLRASLEFD